MIKSIWENYKVQLTLSITLAIVLVATNVYKNPAIIISVILGSLLGTFVLDLDYIIYAYFLEPEKPYSKTLKQFAKHKDFKNFAHYLFYNKEAVKEKTLNSFIFQIALAGMILLTAFFSINILIKTLIISAFANSIYKMITYSLDNQIEDWFWVLKEKPTKNGIMMYALALIGLLIYTINIF